MPHKRETEMTPNKTEELSFIREGVRALCAEFPAEYWRRIDEEKGFPEAFVTAMTEAGWLSAMIPEEYGGRPGPRRGFGDPRGGQPLRR